MNSSIIQFLQKQSCASICCIDDAGKPYCFSCFYVFNSEDGVLHFKSSANSHHAGLMKKNPFIAGTVMPDKLNKLIVMGVQFEAEVLEPEHPLVKKDPGYYYKKNPLGLAIPGEIWTVQINNIKMTDSTKLFGEKIRWNRQEQANGLL